MPWKCPACQTQINHDGDRPEFRRVYRCHVCRLELVLDAATDKLTVAPLPINPNQAGQSGPMTIHPPSLPPCAHCRRVAGVEEETSTGSFAALVCVSALRPSLVCRSQEALRVAS
jgi:hypothetical protein